MVMHIYRLLNELETNNSQYSEWLYNLSAEKNNLRKIVAAKIDQAVTPIFAKIIAYIDQYHNLNLLNGEQTSQFWLTMFDSKVLSLYLNDLDQMQGREAISVENSHHYECRMPFFWVIKAAIDCQWNKHDGMMKVYETTLYILVIAINVSCILGKDLKNNIGQVCVSLNDTPLGEALKTITDQEYGGFYSHYLHDFELSITQSTNSQVYS